MKQVVNPRGPIRLLPVIRQIRLVIQSNHARVGRDDQPIVGIQRLRELLEWNVTRPFEVIDVTRNWNLAVPPPANRYTRRHHIADVAFDVRIDRILRGSPYVFHDRAEFFPALRFAEQHISVGQTAGFRGGPP